LYSFFVFHPSRCVPVPFSQTFSCVSMGTEMAGLELVGQRLLLTWRTGDCHYLALGVSLATQWEPLGGEGEGGAQLSPSTTKYHQTGADGRQDAHQAPNLKSEIRVPALGVGGGCWAAPAGRQKAVLQRNTKLHASCT
jgi:hypothetical protein